MDGIQRCKNCDDYIMEFNGVLNHYTDYQREQLRIKCWNCDCEKPEEKK